MGKAKDYIKAGVRKLLPGHDPDFIIIGAQKAGTSTLHYFLNQHPDLVGSSPKEVHFFEKYINHPDKDQNWYRNHFKSFSFLKRNQLFFEASPNYIYHEAAAINIRKYYPRIKLIVVLREPVSRAYSAWNMYKTLYKRNERKFKVDGQGNNSPVLRRLLQGRDSFPSLEEVIVLERKLMEEGREMEPAILRRGLYYNQIRTYLAHFDPNQLLILGFRELMSDPGKTGNKVLEFLELKPFRWGSGKEVVKNKGLYNASLSVAERKILQDFYQEPNRLLFELLGKEPDW